MKKWDAMWINARICTCEKNIHLIDDGAIAVSDGIITWIGSMASLPQAPEQMAKQIHNVQEQLLTPGLIDCHTHLVYAGERAHEFEQRLLGMSYAEICKRGGGIKSTVKATREASIETLFSLSLKRAKALMQSGVTTLEIKSGYGLDWASEMRMLQVASMLEAYLPLTIKKTFLGAHTIPAEFQHSPDEYVSLICEDMIPKLVKEKCADAVDVFCENIAFNLEQTEAIFKTAAQYGLAIKCHAEQLSNTGAAKLAASYGALSADHLEFLTKDGVQAMAASGTVAVLLPSAYYFLREKQLPPIEALREAQVPIALASDCNPGTSPTTSMLLVLNMACTLFSLNVEEALLGVTKHAAAALGLSQTHGSLTVGKQADFVIWDAQEPAELAYYLGADLLLGLVKGGVYVLRP